MRLVVDTSVIISALIKRRSVAFTTILKTKHELFVPEYVLEELLRHMKRIEEKSELSIEEIYIRLTLITNKLRVVPKQKVMEFIETAKRMIGHRDEKDVPFVATLLAINGEGIISYDSDFEEITRYKYRWIKPKDLLSL